MLEALSRLHATGVDPTAGQSERDPMLPEFAGLDQQLPLPMRTTLIELRDRGAIKIERVELADREPSHPRVLRIADMRWHTLIGRPHQQRAAGVTRAAVTGDVGGADKREGLEGRFIDVARHNDAPDDVGHAIPIRLKTHQASFLFARRDHGVSTRRLRPRGATFKLPAAGWWASDD